MKKKTSKLSWFGTGAFAIIGVVYIMPILIVLINSFKSIYQQRTIQTPDKADMGRNR